MKAARGGLILVLALSCTVARGEAANDEASSLTFEAAPAALGSWRRVGECAGHEPHELIFAVAPRGLGRMRRMLLERSDPASPRFRQWLSRAAVERLTRNDDGMRALRDFLEGHGEEEVAVLSQRSGFLRARAPIAAWERLLSTKFYLYKHVETGDSKFRASEYALPKSLLQHVGAVLGVLDLEEPRAALLGSSGASSRGPTVGCDAEADLVACDTFEALKAVRGVVVSPDVLREAYNMPAPAEAGTEDAKSRAKTSQLVFGSLSQHWSPSDRKQFEGAFGLSSRGVRQLDMGNGRASNKVCAENMNACAEANLDVQYMLAMSPHSRTGFYYLPTELKFFDFLWELIEVTQFDLPHVISISYGMPEVGVSHSGLYVFNFLAMKVSLRGATLVVASGDDGAAGSLARNTTFGRCWLVDYLANLQGGTGWQASWPASSPWVTAVGATMGIGSGHAEVACQVNATGAAAASLGRFTPLITSGGGFSNLVDVPSWQRGHHASKQRGIPDLSLAGNGYAIVIGGKWLTVDGTSASAPVFAGMVSLINAERLAMGKPTVGFINPLLYNSTDALKDITEGDNRCAAEGAPCCGGYDAAEGWDPVTGLGSVDFGKLREALAGAGTDEANHQVEMGVAAESGGSQGDGDGVAGTA